MGDVGEAGVSETGTLNELKAIVLGRLTGVRRRMRTHFAIEGVARVCGLLVALCAITLLMDWWLEVSIVARLCCWGAILVATGWVIWQHLIRPLTLPMPPVDIADALDRRALGRPPIAPRVATILQLDPIASPHPDASPELARQAVVSSFRVFDQVDLKHQLNQKHLWWSALLAVLAILIPVGFTAAFPRPARLWAERWLMGSNQPWPRATVLEVVGVETGRLVVPRGEAAPLRVLVKDEKEPTEVVWMRMMSVNGSRETVSLEKFTTGDFRYEIPPLQSETHIEIWGGDGRAEPFDIVPLDRPRIVQVSLESQHPQETTWQTHRFAAGDGNVRLQPGTKARLRMTMNVPVSAVQVDREGPGSEQLSHDVNLDTSTECSLEWTHSDEVRLRVMLTAADSGLISRPHPLVIGRLDDNPPRVAARWLGVRQRVTPQATIPLTLTVRDDFGIREVSIHVETTGKSLAPVDAPEATPLESSGESTGEIAVPPPLSPPAEATGQIVVFGPKTPTVEQTVELEHRIALVDRQLAPGQIVTVQVRASDDHFAGSQPGASPKLAFRIVSPEELFREILLSQQQLRARLRKARDQAEDLRGKMVLGAAIDDSSSLLRTHQVNTREIGQVTAALNATVVEMRLNQLGGEELWNLITRGVLEPLAALQTGPLDRQRRGLESLLGDSPESFEEISTRQQELVTELDRILSNMAQWDSFIDVINELDAVIKLESLIRRQTEALKSKQAESIFDN